MTARDIIEAQVRRTFEDLDCLAIKTIDGSAKLQQVRRDIERLHRTLAYEAQRRIEEIELKEAEA